ncbi:hypothetical protein GCM10027277_07800 [Pseudoduganella ginsengisoli]|uniref:Flagellar assembly protein FliH n=1 Tax=Pseudoduganella ginsengisoli TaxID=1462440 RepID=A0A6L6Q1T4_9BURK|nr:FliH/SctL family protein [Pseudoduganella ginsengisoli]MTW03271.1 hypothetical protein [Pseudoduganella ginsengisoli]
MASILRSPPLSDQKRKLPSRRQRVQPPAEATLPAASSEASPTASPAASPVSAAAPQPDLQALIDQARESVLAQFKQEAETAREMGRQRGLQEGREAGAAESRQAFAAELARMRSIVDKLHGAVENGVAGLEEMAVAIAFESVCRILGDKAITAEGVRGIVRETVSHVAARDGVTVRLHPDDLSALRSVGALEAPADNGAPVSWVADTTLALGGCIVEGGGGELDARLDTQIERLRAALLAARGA